MDLQKQEFTEQEENVDIEHKLRNILMIDETEVFIFPTTLQHTVDK